MVMMSSFPAHFRHLAMFGQVHAHADVPVAPVVLETVGAEVQGHQGDVAAVDHLVRRRS